MNKLLLELYLNNHHKALGSGMSDYFKSLELWSVGIPSLRLMQYIQCNMKPKRGEYSKSQLIELKPTISGISRNGFFDGVKELTSLGVIIKYSPHLFLVNPGYVCSMNGEQVSRFNFDVECALVELNFKSV